MIGVVRGTGILAALAFLAGCGRGERSGAAADTVTADSSAVASGAIDPRCGMATQQAHDDPVQLLREYVERDAAGEFVARTAWFAGAVTCPAREAEGSSTYGVIASVEIDSIARTDTTAAALVRWRRLGFVTGAGTNHASFEAVPGVVTGVVRAYRTPHGWRIVSPAPRGQVLYSAFPVRQALGPAAHTLVAQMAEQARRGTIPAP